MIRKMIGANSMGNLPEKHMPIKIDEQPLKHHNKRRRMLEEARRYIHKIYTYPGINHYIFDKKDFLESFGLTITVFSNGEVFKTGYDAGKEILLGGNLSAVVLLLLEDKDKIS